MVLSERADKPTLFIVRCMTSAALAKARARNFTLGVKLVCGAYQSMKRPRTPRNLLRQIRQQKCS